MIKNCIICGEPFEPKRKDAKCCSATCRSKRNRATDSGLSVATDIPATDNATDKIESVTAVKDLDAQGLYDAIGAYQHDEWITSPEFEELMHRLNTWKYDRLEAEGYKTPAWLYHKNNKNLNK